MSALELERVKQAWVLLGDVLRVPRTATEYEELVALLDEL